MRESSPNLFSTTDHLSDSWSPAKSLFWKILATSPCGSRFCGDSEGYLLGKFFRINILGNWAREISGCSAGPSSVVGGGLCTSPTARAAPAGGEVPRPAKCACLRMTRIDASDLRSVCDQFEAGTPPYFCSHFNSSRTLILPCQGFLLRLWPSPGNTSSLFGMPSE